MKLPGVESADVSLDKASADISLKADNRITITELRQVLKKNGYPTRDAQLELRGRIVVRDGKLMVDLLNGGMMQIDSKGTSPEPGDRVVVLTGRSHADGKTGEALSVQAVR